MSQPSWIGYELGGRYRIDDELGQGGMAAVFKAMDPNLRRVVAVKLIHTHLSKDPEFIRRFEQEAAAIAQLNHPNIVKVYDYNNDGDTYFMVLEFLVGETLLDTLIRIENQGQQMSQEDTIKYGAGICDALEYAHRRGMLHRDIKPANIMLTVDGKAVLMDFGIVKMTGGDQHTATGAVIGTAKYMSPEQVRGEQADERSDIYSLGVTLFEMVSGRHPYNADSAMSMLMMHVNAPVPDIRELNPSVPPALQHIIEKSLAKDPADRYQSASELSGALRNMTDPWPEFSKPTPEPTFVQNPVPAANSTPDSTFVDSAPTPAPPAAANAAAGKAYPSPAATQLDTPTELPGEAGLASGKSKVPLYAALGCGGLLLIGSLVLFGVLVLPSLLGGGDNRTGDGETTPVSEVTEASGDSTPEDGGSDNGDSSGSNDTSTPKPTVAPTQTAVSDPLTETPLPTSAPTIAATPVPTLAPTIAPSATTAAFPEPYVAIYGISLSGSTYNVSYETYGFTEVLPGQHIHFFFDTVAPSQAGVPGGGPWYLWGGPRPFNGYTDGDKGTASQMCALVANADHTVQQNTGNCYPLP